MLMSSLELVCVLLLAAAAVDARRSAETDDIHVNTEEDKSGAEFVVDEGRPRGFIGGLNHVNVRACAAGGERGSEDEREEQVLQSLIDFYGDVLGLENAPGMRPKQFASRGAWLVDARGDPLVHLEIESSARCQTGVKSGVQTSEMGGIIDHIAFDASGPRELFLERLERLGVASELVSVPEIGLKQVFVRDPAGNRVELMFRG
jgi:catechol 2,3-dioxygenase-like lactoylglutathione lyase family enzyme